MVQPAGSIDITDDDQYIAIGPYWLGQEGTEYWIHAYVFFRALEMPPGLAEFGASWEKYELSACCNAEAGVDIRIIYTIDSTTQRMTYEGSLLGATSEWESVEMVPQIPTDAASALIGLQPRTLRLRVRMGLVDETAGVSAVSGLHVRGMSDYQSSHPMAQVQRDGVAQIYAPDNFLSAYHGMCLITDTINQYLEQSRIDQCVPLFGMPIVAA